MDSCRQLLGVLQAVHVKVKERAEACHPDCSLQPGNVSTIEHKDLVIHSSNFLVKVLFLLMPCACSRTFTGYSH